MGEPKCPICGTGSEDLLFYEKGENEWLWEDGNWILTNFFSDEQEWSIMYCSVCEDEVDTGAMVDDGWESLK